MFLRRFYVSRMSVALSGFAINMERKCGPHSSLSGQCQVAECEGCLMRGNFLISQVNVTQMFLSCIVPRTVQFIVDHVTSEFYIHGSVHRDSILIRSNEMQ